MKINVLFCDQTGHLTRNCLAIPVLKETLQGTGQADVNYVNQWYDPFSNTYNLGFKDHPAFKWGNQAQTSQARPPLGYTQPLRPPSVLLNMLQINSSFLRIPFQVTLPKSSRILLSSQNNLSGIPFKCACKGKR